MVQKTLRRAPEHSNNVNQTVSDGSAHALASVPDIKYYNEYISRDIDDRPDMEYATFAYDKAMNMLLYGPTGPGKTSFFMAWAALKRLKFYSVASNLALDPSQMFGKWGQDENGRFVWYDGGVTDIVRNGGVLIVNEINFMSERIAPVLYELFDKRREITLLDHKGEKIRAHRPNCWCSLPANVCQERWVLLGADYNPDYAGTRPLNAALRNRFALQFEWDYEPEIEEKLVPYPTLLDIVRNIRQQKARIETPVATNMMQEFVAVVKDLGIDFAIRNFVAHFAVEERAAVAPVFEARIDDLKEDFKPDDAEGWNQFEGSNSDWILEEEDDERDDNQDDPDLSEWERDLQS